MDPFPIVRKLLCHKLFLHSIKLHRLHVLRTASFAGRLRSLHLSLSLPVFLNLDSQFPSICYTMYTYIMCIFLHSLTNFCSLMLHATALYSLENSYFSGFTFFTIQQNWENERSWLKEAWGFRVPKGNHFSGWLTLSFLSFTCCLPLYVTYYITSIPFIT